MNQEYHLLLSDSSFLSILLSTDVVSGKRVQGVGCQRTSGCLGKLDCAYYRRKPRGLKLKLLEEEEFRISFCCRKCRKRHTPESVLFLYRKVYAFLVVFIALHFRSGVNPQVTLRKVRMICGASEVTVSRWKRWILKFLKSARWRELRRKLCARFEVGLFPRSLFNEFMKSVFTPREVTLKVLSFLSILSILNIP